MGVKMMRWRPWPPLQTRKFEVRLKVQRLEGLIGVNNDWLHAGPERDGRVPPRFAVEIKWKGPKIALSTLRRNSAKRSCTREEVAVIKEDDGRNDVVLVQWEEDFQSVCTFSANKNNAFHSWELAFSVFMLNGPKNKAFVLGSATLNLAEFAMKTEERESQLQLPVLLSSGTSDRSPSLYVTLSLLELRATQDSIESVQRSELPVTPSFEPGETPPSEKDELSALKAGLRKVKILTEYVSTRKAKKACREEDGSEGTCSAKSEEGEYAYPFDSDSVGNDDGESEDEAKARKSFSYGTLPYANFAGGSFYSNSRIHGDHEDLVYYSNRKSDVCHSQMGNPVISMPESSILQNSKRRILNWRKRKLSFRSPKAKGEPLLKKDNGEVGGDDIDFARRQLSSDESLSFWWQKTDEDSSAHRSSISDFGDDHFAIGCWETKDVMSRDGHLKLQTQVFFASIDQRSERAAGESACTSLVAVIADWLQNNVDLMPIKSQFDSLIREGSLEWRNLCENETYRERFPDKHFDLETILQAKVCSLSTVPQKSFIGFFHPNATEEERFEFLHGAMSFDNIWEEISRAASNHASDGGPQVYIISWNDHFFILKVESDAYYIIDTLGERLYEGCNEAYILKFDKDTIIYKQPSSCSDQLSQQTPVGSQQNNTPAMESKNLKAHQVIQKEDTPAENSSVGRSEEPIRRQGSAEEEIVCFGKESCKEYIKSFLAAIPIRELLADIRKGLIKSTPLHHRLQIEFHFTQLQQETPINSMVEVAPPMSQAVEVVPATSQAVEVAMPTSQAVEVAMPTSQAVEVAMPTSQAVEVAMPTSQAVEVAMPTSQPVEVAMPTSQPVEVAMPMSQPVEVALPMSQAVEVVPPMSQAVEVVPPMSQAVEIVPPMSQAVEVFHPMALAVEVAD